MDSKDWWLLLERHRTLSDAVNQLLIAMILQTKDQELMRAAIEINSWEEFPWSDPDLCGILTHILKGEGDD